MDAYINGVISGRITFTNVPKQNYNDIYVGCNGGFNGSLSNLVYYDHALTVFDINNIILKNPNLTKSSSANSSYGFYSYISSNWYTLKM
jgi:pectate lyase